MRVITVLLLFVVFFLAGTLFGVNQNNGDYTNDRGNENVVETINDEDIEEIITEVEQEETPELVDTTAVLNMDESVNFTQKMASFLEGTVTLFYDGVVTILYQISQLFF